MASDQKSLVRHGLLISHPLPPATPPLTISDFYSVAHRHSALLRIWIGTCMGGLLEPAVAEGALAALGLDDRPPVQNGPQLIHGGMPPTLCRSTPYRKRVTNRTQCGVSFFTCHCY